MHRLKVKPTFTYRRVNLQTAIGSSLKVDGSITVTMNIGGADLTQEFLVVRELNRNVIWGLDFLKSH